MTSRPVDPTGDILPVLSPASLLTGPAAAAASLSDHLRLFRGDWWEYADQGNEILDLISSSRLTEKDLPALSSYLSSYILRFPAIRSVSAAQASLSGHALTFSCAAHTDSGGAFPVTFSWP